jgi:outer membrane protein OmpA-like peptidoglycan-associated protein
MTISAQNDSISKSVIRISENNLNSIINRIVESKQKQLSLQNTVASQQATKDTVTPNLGVTSLNREIDSLETVLKTLNSRNRITLAPDNTNLYLKQNLDVLHYKLDELKNLLEAHENRNVSTYISQKKPVNNKVPIIIANTEDNEAYKQMLQAKLDSISNQINKNQTTEPLTDLNLKTLNGITDKLDALQNELNLSKKAPANKIASSNYSYLLEKYSAFKTQLYFENNSTSIDNNQGDSLINLVSILKENDNIDVFLKGFASKKGSVLYNQNLSLLRTESVKKDLISKGIHPTRILSMYYGIDYKTSTEQEARRVDITLVIRK